MLLSISTVEGLGGYLSVFSNNDNDNHHNDDDNNSDMSMMGIRIDPPMVDPLSNFPFQPGLHD